MCILCTPKWAYHIRKLDTRCFVYAPMSFSCDRVGLPPPPHTHFFPWSHIPTILPPIFHIPKHVIPQSFFHKKILLLLKIMWKVCTFKSVFQSFWGSFFLWFVFIEWWKKELSCTRINKCTGYTFLFNGPDHLTTLYLIPTKYTNNCQISG